MSRASKDQTHDSARAERQTPVNVRHCMARAATGSCPPSIAPLLVLPALSPGERRVKPSGARMPVNEVTT